VRLPALRAPVPVPGFGLRRNPTMRTDRTRALPSPVLRSELRRSPTWQTVPPTAVLRAALPTGLSQIRQIPTTQRGQLLLRLAAPLLVAPRSSARRPAMLKPRRCRSCRQRTPPSTSFRTGQATLSCAPQIFRRSLPRYPVRPMAFHFLRRRTARQIPRPPGQRLRTLPDLAAATARAPRSSCLRRELHSEVQRHCQWAGLPELCRCRRRLRALNRR